MTIPTSIRFILAALLVGAGFYSFSIAFYNASMSALDAYAPVLETLAVRFWSFVVLALLLFAAGAMLFVATIRKINREDRQLRS